MWIQISILQGLIIFRIYILLQFEIWLRLHIVMWGGRLGGMEERRVAKASMQWTVHVNLATLREVGVCTTASLITGS